MPGETSNQLVEYAREQVGDSLRTVSVLYENDCEVVYLRKNLQGTYNPDQYKRVAGSFRIDIGEEIHRSGNSPVGNKNCIIHYHENAYVFQFPHDGCHSILLSVEPEVGSRLKSFIEGCDNQI